MEGGVAIGAAYSGAGTAPSNGLIVEGSVGIGTPTPANTLDVEGGVAIGSTYSGTSTAPSNGLIVEGNVGIGTRTPESALNVVLDSIVDVMVDSYYDGNLGARMWQRKARGTESSPSAVLSDDFLGTNLYSGYDGTLFDDGAQINIQASEDWTGSAHGAKILFRTATNGAISPTTRMTIDHDGGVGIGTSTPANKLDVEGGVAIGSAYSGTSAAPSDGLIGVHPILGGALE